MTDLTVLFVHYEWPGVTDCGGSGRVARRLRDRLRDRGYTVPLVTDPDDGHYLTFPLRRHRAIKRALREHTPDVVYAGSSLPTAVGLPRLCDRYDAPLVIKTMGSDVHNPNSFQRIRPLLNRVNARLFARADRVVCQSEAMATHVREWVEPDIIPNGIDTDRYDWQPQRRHRPLRVLTVGRVAPVKQIWLGIEAVAQLRQRGHQAVYRVVGDGSERERLQAEYEHDWLEWPGWVDDPRDHYQWADLFLLSSAHESFGMVLLEALASGVPCVTTNTGGQVDVINGQIGTAVDPDPIKLALALERLSHNYSVHQGATQRYVDDRFSLEQMTDGFERVFRHVSGLPISADSVPATA